MFGDLKIGYCPTRRFVFSKEDAHKYKDLIRAKLISWGVTLVDLESINEEGLLYDDAMQAEQIIQLMKKENVDALFFPHCNFGTEDTVCKVARAVGKPVLLWAPRDEMPLPDGTRLRDSQCGIFATGKVLRRFRVPYTYINNCRVDDALFERGFRTFMGAVNVAKTFDHMRILQIGPRPAGFWSVIVNEGELLERFNVQLFPLNMVDFVSEIQRTLAADSSELTDAMNLFQSKMDCSCASEDTVRKLAAMKLVMRAIARREGCTAGVIQCWTALQDALGVMPCAAMALLSEEGFPMICETDIHGAITALMAGAANFGKTPPFFCDVTVRHPEMDNCELLFHCGNFAPSLAKEGACPTLRTHSVLQSACPGTCEHEIVGGDITVLRFDGDNGDYQLFIGEGKGIDGPMLKGSYLWFEVKDWPKWEQLLVTGPFIHHVACVHGHVAAALYEACKYIGGVSPVCADPTVDEILASFRQ